MPVTHGYRRKSFEWSIKGSTLTIRNEAGLVHTYSITEINRILDRLRASFGAGWFPLANNVEKLYQGTEALGLGRVIYELKPGDTLHAQGASYLGVVLEELGVLQWNERRRGIQWRIVGENL